MAAAWSAPAQELALRAQSEFPGRVVVLAVLHEPAALALPADTRAQLLDARQTLFPWVVSKGIVLPFRRHWFDRVRCAVYVPADPADSQAELWAMAHEIGHCVARLGGWQETLWRQAGVVARHRAESWADAFATQILPEPGRRRAAELAIARRALLADDAAYLTERAIGCALSLPQDSGVSLRETGRRVEQQLSQPGCLMDAAQLQATQAFLASLRPARSSSP